MHVLMLCALDVWALPGDGGAPSLYRTLRAYGERGHRVTFVAPTIGANASRLQRGHAPAAPPLIAGVTFERFHLPSLQESRMPRPAFVAKVDQKLRFALLFPRLAARQAERVLAGEKVDVLYAYEVHGALAARRLRRRFRLPTVARFQGTVLHPTLGSPLARLRKYEEVVALRLPADLYIMTDDGTQGDEVLARLNPWAMSKLRFWRNGLDMDRLRPPSQGERAAERSGLDIPDDAFVLLTASRLAAWKRVDRALAALPQILRSTTKALLLIVGDGEERAHLERQARELGVAGRVRFVGAVPQERVAGYMHAADVLLALADLSNVGNPLLEAMSCGLPVVAVDAGDTRTLVRDGDTGRLLASGAPGEVARAVAALAEDVAERHRLGEGARRFAESHFWSWEARLEAELEEVERLVGERVAAGVAEPARRAG
jgi:glycosyltransferase involved in cell wall biosynthesis